MGKKERADAAHKQKEQKVLARKSTAARNDTTAPVLAASNASGKIYLWR